MKFLGSLLQLGLMFVGQGAWAAAFKAIGLSALQTRLAGKAQGPRLSDLTINLDGEGLELPMSWGRNRLDMKLVWCSGLRERKEEHGGGLFSEGYTEYEYAIDMFFEGGMGPITRFNRIKLGTDVIYDYNDGDEKGMTLTWHDIDGGSDESKAGYWQGDFWIKGKNVRGTARLYRGTLNQPVDALLIADKGAGNASNYPNKWCMAIELNDAARYGNQPPRPSVEIQNDRTDLADVILDLGALVGLEPIDFDLSALDGLTVSPTPEEGFVADSRRAAGDYIGELMDTYHFYLPEVNGKITAVLSPPSLDGVEILDDKSVRVNSGYEPSAAIKESPLKSTDAQNLSEVKEYISRDPNRDYQPGYRYARRNDATSEKKSSVSTNGAIRGGRAASIVRVLLAEEYALGTGRDITRPLIGIIDAPADAFYVDTEDGVKPMAIDSISLPFFGPVAETLQGFDPLVYDLPELPDTEGLERETPIQPGAPIIFVSEGPIVGGDGFWLNTPALIVAACAYPTDVWEAMRVSYDKLDGSDWKEIDEDPLNSEAMIGELTAPYTPLSSAQGFVSSESFTCRLYGGALTTPTNLDDADNYLLFENGLVVCYHAVEKTADSEAGDFYEFSDLYSAVLGTDDFLGTIAAGQRFVVLKHDGVNKNGPVWAKITNNPSSRLGLPLRVRLGDGTDEVQVEVDSFEGMNVKAPSPTIESVSRGGSGELLISGRARTRFFEDAFATSTDLAQFKEYRFAGSGYKYRLEMVGDSVSRTLDLFTTDARGSFDFNVSASDLTALFGFVPNDLSGTIALVGEYGRGRTKVFTADI